MSVNLHAIRAIYGFEMARTWRTLTQSIVSPVISTSLYFVVFGAAIGSRVAQIDGISYGAFIVPGLIMLSLLTQSISNASFGIYFPRFTGTIYELLSAPVSTLEAVVAFVGAAATKSVILGLIILATAALFVPLRIDHPVWMVLFLVLTSVTFSLLGFAPHPVADTPGLAVARTVAMLINEAADAVLQVVCTPEGADAAMKLGLNYPAGPFEWLARWSAGGVVALLDALDAHYRGERYRASPWLRRRVRGL